MEENKLDLSQLERFENLDDQEFKLIKIGSKNPNSFVDVGMFEEGAFSLYEYESTNSGKRYVGAFVRGRGYDYLRTSPIVKVLKYGDDYTEFETAGGFYRLEKI